MRGQQAVASRRRQVLWRACRRTDSGDRHGYAGFNELVNVRPRRNQRVKPIWF
jgi:hypothetical protein